MANIAGPVVATTATGRQLAMGPPGPIGPQGLPGPKGDPGAPGPTWGTPVRKTSSYTGQAGDGPVLADTTGAAWTYTFPASPSDGQRVQLIAPNNSWATNNLTLQGQTGQKVMNPTNRGIVSAAGGTQVVSVPGTLEYMWGQTESTWFIV